MLFHSSTEYTVRLLYSYTWQQRQTEVPRLPSHLSSSACTGSRLPVLTRTGGKRILQSPKTRRYVGNSTREKAAAPGMVRVSGGSGCATAVVPRATTRSHGSGSGNRVFQLFPRSNLVETSGTCSLRSSSLFSAGESKSKQLKWGSTYRG